MLHAPLFYNGPLDLRIHQIVVALLKQRNARPDLAVGIPTVQLPP
jgi:hypothetical protein